jgi:acyl carrier protein
MNDEIRKLIADTLDVDLNEVTDNVEIGDLDTWDSIHQLMIVSGLEEKYGIHYNEDDIFEMTSVGTIIEVTKRKVS